MKLRKFCGERNKENVCDYKLGVCIVYVCMYRIIVLSMEGIKFKYV